MPKIDHRYNENFLIEYFLKQFPSVNIINMFRGGRFINQKHPNISHGKVLETRVATLGAQPNTIRSINKMLRMSVNRDYIRAKNRAAYNFKSHQLENSSQLPKPEEHSMIRSSTVN